MQCTRIQASVQNWRFSSQLPLAAAPPGLNHDSARGELRQMLAGPPRGGLFQTTRGAYRRWSTQKSREGGGSAGWTLTTPQLTLPRNAPFFRRSLPRLSEGVCYQGAIDIDQRSGHIKNDDGEDKCLNWRQVRK